jgi:penicillin-binding protein 1C
VGNFDGHPMKGSTGISGAGPLFHEIMLAAMQGRAPQPLVDERSLVSAEVCTLSGRLPTRDCPEKTRELFVAGTEPAQHCDMHERVKRCGALEERVFERYPAEFMAWAEAAQRPVCASSGEKHGLRVLFPEDGARFKLNPEYRTQEIVLSAQSDASSVQFVVDGRKLATSRPPFRVAWSLAPGAHSLIIETPSGQRSEPVRFTVD